MQPNPGGISLRNILPQARYSRSGDYSFSSCCSDSRNVRAGDLFVALVGSQEDGHTHIAEAVERGASAILSERFVSSPVPLCIVPDTREAYGQICQVLAGTPCDKLFLVGVSGTQGKTATANTIGCHLPGNGGNLGNRPASRWFSFCQFQLFALWTNRCSLLVRV